MAESYSNAAKGPKPHVNVCGSKLPLLLAIIWVTLTKKG